MVINSTINNKRTKHLPPQIIEKWDDLNFPIVNFPFVGINLLSEQECMKYIILMWHDILKPVFFKDFFLVGIYRANGSLWSLRNFYYRYYDFVIATEPTVPCDHFEIFTIAIMTLLTVTDEHVYFQLIIVKSLPFLVHHILPDMTSPYFSMINTTDATSGTVTEQMSSNFVFKGLVLLNLFYFIYELLTMTIVCVLQIKVFNRTIRIFERMV